MCFGNKKKQSDYMPEHNNYCGGFALDAVLTDLKVSEKADPLKTYNEIQKVQSSNLKSDSFSDQFIKDTLNDGTAMSLPSSIALTAQTEDKGLKVTVYIDEKKLKDELGSGSEMLIAEEEAKLDAMVKDTIDLINSVYISDASHFIVLVDNAHHWVAVKKESTVSYTCYNPSSGQCFTKSKLETAVEAAISGKMNSLIIALKE